jgi:hypothetical protein
MRYRLATLVAAAAIAVAAPALAATSVNVAPARVPDSVIMHGPTLSASEKDDGAGWAMAEIDYLQRVCPTVLSSPGHYSASLDRFCSEPHG